KNIENVVGSAYSTKIIGDDQNNLMVGQSGRNFFKGLSGNDRFVTGSEFDEVYGGAGRDTISIEASEKSRKYVDGGPDVDRVSYARSKQGLTIDLTLDRSHLSDKNGGDVYVNVEVFEGTDYDDIIKGNDESTTFIPRAGHNLVYTRGGNDTVLADGGRTEIRLDKGSNKVFLKAGNHIVEGGTGDDEIYFSDTTHTQHRIQGGGGNNRLISDLRPRVTLKFKQWSASTVAPRTQSTTEFALFPHLAIVVPQFFARPTVAQPALLPSAELQCTDFAPVQLVVDLANNALKLKVLGVYDDAKGKTRIKSEDKFSKDSVFQLSFDLEGKQKVKKVALADFIKGEATINWGGIVQGVSMDASLEPLISTTTVDVDLKWAREDNTKEGTTTYRKKCQSKWQVEFSTIDSPSVTIDLTYKKDGRLQVQNVNTLITQDGDDTITGNPGENNKLIGGSGNNHLIDMGGDNQFSVGMGNNNITAGSGYDTLLYQVMTQTWLKNRPFIPYTLDSISVDMASRSVRHVWKASDRQYPDKSFSDRFTGIDHIVGTGNGDRYSGSDDNEQYTTGGGSDTVDMGGGDDLVVVLDSGQEPASPSLKGGSGNDTLVFETRQGVWVDLEAGQGRIGTGKVFDLGGFERVTGSIANDTLYGNELDNVLTPRAGDNQKVYGRGGNDHFLLSEGTHLVAGGNGTDTVDYQALVLPPGTMGVMALQDYRALSDGQGWFNGTTWFNATTWFGSDWSGYAEQAGLPCPNDDTAGGATNVSATCRSGFVVFRYGENPTLPEPRGIKDQLYDIENLFGSKGDDVLFLTLAKTLASGADGNDRLVDLSEGATLRGGKGDDILHASRRNDSQGTTTLGGAGFDVHYGGPGDDKMIADQDADRLMGDKGKDFYLVDWQARGTEISDPDNGNMLMLRGEGATFDNIGLVLNGNFSELYFQDQGYYWVTLTMDAVPRRVRPDGSLDTGHFVEALHQHFPYLRIEDTAKGNKTTAAPLTKQGLKLFYQDRLIRDIRLDNIMIAEADDEVVRSGIGNDDLMALGCGKLNQTEGVPGCHYKLYGEEGHDTFLVRNATADVYPGPGHNRLAAGKQAKVFVSFDSDQSQTFGLSLPSPPEQLRATNWHSVEPGQLVSHGGALTGENSAGFKNARQLTERSQWLEIPGLVTGGAMTLSLQLRVSGLDQAFLPIIYFADAVGRHGIRVDKTNRDDLVLTFSDAAAETILHKRVPDFFQDGQWVHLTLRVNRAGLVDIYKDGKNVLQGVRVEVPKRMIRPMNFLGREAVALGTQNPSNATLTVAGLMVVDHSMAEEAISQLAKSPSGNLLKLSSECDSIEVALTDCPDYLELGDRHYLDGQETVRSWLKSVERLPGMVPVADGRHIFVADDNSKKGLFQQGDGYSEIVEAPGRADLLVVKVNRDNQAVFRKQNDDLLIYLFKDGESLETASLTGISDRRRYQGYFNSNHLNRVERIELNHRVLLSEDLWSLTRDFPKPPKILNRARLEDVRVLERQGQLMLFFGGNHFPLGMTLGQLWPVAWDDYESHHPLVTVSCQT
ncbi:calcium-binding protein, partial [Endozoicomonas sp. SESOKO4]|uniref:calcium-binding protein n=1 Tax=Endozoicomonas sp. SESOKO4 TaxID=2828745 RepID=UPI002149113E